MRRREKCETCGHGNGLCNDDARYYPSCDCAMCYNASMWIEPLVYNKELKDDHS